MLSRVKKHLMSFGLAVLVMGCSTYTGTAETLRPRELRDEPGWLAVEGVPLHRQTHEHDCGPTALLMVLDYHRPGTNPAVLAPTRDRQVGAATQRDRQVGAATQRDRQVGAAELQDHQVSVAELRDLARERGFSAFVVAGTPEDLVYELRHKRPAIVGVAKPTLKGAVTHYEVVVGINPNSQRIATLDPAAGWRQNSFAGFLTEWEATGRVLLVLLPADSPSPPIAARSTF